MLDIQYLQGETEGIIGNRVSRWQTLNLSLYIHNIYVCVMSVNFLRNFLLKYNVHTKKYTYGKEELREFSQQTHLYT